MKSPLQILLMLLSLSFLWPSLGAAEDSPILDCGDRVASMMVQFTALKDGQILIGRQQEAVAVINALERGNDVLLKGDQGSGRTSVVQKVRDMLNVDNAPDSLKNAEIFTFNWQNDSGIHSAARGDQKRPDQILLEKVEQLKKDGKKTIIIHIPDMDHLILSPEAQVRPTEAQAAFLAEVRRLSASKNILVIGEAKTTTQIEKDPFGRDFQIVKVENLTDTEVRQLLLSDAKRIRDRYNVEIDEGAIDAAILLSKRYFPAAPISIMPRQLLAQAAVISRNVKQDIFTEKQFIEEQIAELKLSIEIATARPDAFRKLLTQLKEDVVKLEKQLEDLKASSEKTEPLAKKVQELQSQKESLEAELIKATDDFTKRARLENDLRNLDTQLTNTLKELNGVNPTSISEVNSLMVVAAVRQRIDGPINYSGADNVELARILQKEVTKIVKGQDRNIQEITDILVMDLLGLRDPDDKGPRGVFIIAGPTGTGKDFTVAQMHKIMTGGVGEPFTMDGNTLSSELSVSELKGAAPGYVGYGPGKLVEGIRSTPEGGWVGITEGEKAHRAVTIALMQLLETGRMEGSDGTVANARGNVFFLTENVGDLYYNPIKLNELARHLSSFDAFEAHFGNMKAYSELFPDRAEAEKKFNELGARGFLDHALRREDGKFTDLTREAIQTEIKRLNPPEFIARVDEIVVFDPLTRPDIQAIIEIQLAKIKDFPLLKNNGNDVSLSEGALTELVNRYEAISLGAGARGLKDLVRNEVTNLIKNAVLENRLEEGRPIQINYTDGKFVLEQASN